MEKATDKNLLKLAGEYFKANKRQSVVFVSSDGQLFESINAGSWHVHSKGVRLFKVTPDMIPKTKAAPEKVKPQKLKDNGKN